MVGRIMCSMPEKIQAADYIIQLTQHIYIQAHNIRTTHLIHIF